MAERKEARGLRRQRRQSDASEAPAANYTRLSEGLRRVTPTAIQCSVFCGGRHCKYENPNSLNALHMAVDGLYSHWVTDDILACARPSTYLITQKNLIQQFQSLGIKSIINLQQPGEHASCGPPLEDSGFTYQPTAFMESNIYFYNFAWRDYGEATTTHLLDMVKVMAFALEEGKVAIHCHAGLGRTGVLIACYLVFSLRVRANDAIRYVRLKRPNSVQTSGQITCVQEFEQFVFPHSTVFCNKDLLKDGKCHDFNLKQYLARQNILLHGYEARMFRHLPKIVFVICERLLQLCSCQNYFTKSSAQDESKVPLTKTFFVSRINSESRLSFKKSKSSSTEGEDSSSASMIHSSASTRSLCTEMDGNHSSEGETSQHVSIDISPSSSRCTEVDESYLMSALNEEVIGQIADGDMSLDESAQTNEFSKTEKNYCTDDIIQALLADHQMLDEVAKKSIYQLRIELNYKCSVWNSLRLEKNIYVLTGLLYDWLELLKTPALNCDSLSYIVIFGNNPEKCLKKLDKAVQYLLEYLLRFIRRLQPITKNSEQELIKRFMSSLTQQSIEICGVLQPTGKGFNRLRTGTRKVLFEFMINFLNLISDT
ncbi:protein tyrosine phosphatase domain-containing protein 1-like [Schistocerca serialis cubense]|uniref:protein tyrosine phosphatase domain-containing protein 1-like n=1 Tax=Schistocerca serialis cubense TaxID=2023355 RepID=UPI00214F2048|nr:protein tyrosine phosphatase domain-containing protein 1-like [Schistocerca serialis cubense]